MPDQKPTVLVSYEPDKDLGVIAYDFGDSVQEFKPIQFQNGPVGDSGYNGVQNEDVISLLCVRLRDLNKRFPCRENSLAITKLEEARFWLEERTRIREHQGVEGRNEAHTS